MQGKSDTYGIGRKKISAIGVIIEVFEKLSTVDTGYATMQVLEFHISGIELLANYTGHALPLTKNNHLFISFSKNFIKDVYQFIDFGIMAGCLVEDIGAVAHHTHHIQENHQVLTVLFIQKTLSVPFNDQFCNTLPVLFMNFALKFCHADKQHLSLIHI